MKNDIPQKSGERKIYPGNERFAKLIENNREIFKNSINIFEHNIPYYREKLKSELSLEGKEIILTGHQPEFSHCGIIFKNYLASEIASSQNSFPVNVIIDYDLPRLFFLFPSQQGTEFINLELPVKNKEKIVHDLVIDVGRMDKFISDVNKYSRVFPEEIKKNILNFSELLNTRLQENNDHLSLISELRKEWEIKNRFTINDIPASEIYSGETFSNFVMEISKDAVSFQKCYNAILTSYRRERGIRTKANPVPDLGKEVVDLKNYYELPFWYIDSEGFRYSLYGDESGELFILINGEPEKAEENNRFRPKALMNTIFLRLFLGEIFIHGLGGSKYDAISDLILKEYFEVPPPAFITATYSRRIRNIDNSLYERISLLMNEQKLLLTHPEKFLDPSNPLVIEKEVLIDDIKVAPKNLKKEIADRINTITALMSAELTEKMEKISDQIEELDFKLTRENIICSREFPYFYFDTLF